MTPALLLPAGLAALAALALPLLIHLARRTEHLPTDFAAFQWLRAKPRPRHRPRFDELPLLAVRLLLLALLALAMAEPVLIGAAPRMDWVAVVSGVDPGKAADLVSGGARGAWLSPGFPPLDTPAPSGPIPIASLVRELDATLAPGARLTVVVPPVIEGADAERPRLSRPVDWRVVPGRMSARIVPDTPAPPLAIRFAPGVAGLGYLRAAATALRPVGAVLDVAPVEAALPRTGALAWLAPGELPAAVRDWAGRGGTLLVPAGAVLPSGPATVAWRDPLGAPLAEEVSVGGGRVLRFTRPLTPAEMPILAEPGFPTALARLLAGAPPPPARVAATDYAPVPGAEAHARASDRRDLRPWLALLIAAVLLAERWLATRPRRSVAP